MKNKIISALLVVVMLASLVTLTSCSTEDKELYQNPVNTEPLYDFTNKKTYIRDDGKTKTTFSLVEENSGYELYFSEDILEIMLKSKATGEEWFSNPTPTERANGIRSEMSSQLILFYLNKTTGAQKTLESYMDCVMNENEEAEEHQFYVVNHEGHLRVIYLLGKVKPDYVIPTCLSEEDALAYIETLRSNKRLATSKYISGGSIYSKLTPKVWSTYPTDRQEELLAIAPNIGEYISKGETVYLIGDTTKWNNAQVMEELEDAFVNVIGLTVEERDAMNEKYGVVKESDKNFWIPVDYRLTEDGLSVTIPNEEIQYDTDTFAVASISLLQYFGSTSGVKNKSEDEIEEGYFLLPDGSGSILEFNNGKTNITSDIRLQLYGLDDGRERSIKPYSNQMATLPVFGIKRDNSAMFAIIENGDKNATIIADIAGKNANAEDRNKCYTMFTMSEYEEMQFQSTGSSTKIYQNKMNSDDICVKYTILEESKADYNGMAAYYRNYLIKNGVLTQKDYSNVPFNIEIVGAYDHDTAFLGVGYTEMRALTTFDQCGELIKKLSEAGIKNISLNYKGWANNGLFNTCYSKAKVLKALGGKKGLSSLIELANQLGVQLYFETELAFVYETEMFDGYNALTQASRLVTRDISYHNQYYVDWNTIDEERKATIVSPSVIYKDSKGNAVNVLEDLKGYNINGVSLGSLGWNLPGNYKVKDFYDRSLTAATYASVADYYSNSGMKVMAKGGNSYLLSSLDSIFEICNTSSEFNLADYSVPFYQMVIHGYIEYSGEPINLNGDSKTAFLQAVEAGAGLYYRWCYVPNDEVQDLLFDGMYSLSYESWFDEAVEFYKAYNELLNSTAGAQMVKHENVAEKVNKVTYSNGVTVYVNYNSKDVTVDGITVKAKDFAKGGIK